jgi:glutathione S-transferase
VIGYNIWWASAIDKGAILSGYPALVNYLNRIKERPAFQKAFSRS